MRMRVIVADDQPDVRSALRLLLEEKPGVSVVGEASTAADLLTQVKSVSPDLVLLDWELPGTIPADLVSLIHAASSTPSIIVLSSRPQMRRVALSAGAQEFVCKSDPPEYLMLALDNCFKDSN